MADITQGYSRQQVVPRAILGKIDSYDVRYVLGVSTALAIVVLTLTALAYLSTADL